MASSNGNGFRFRVSDVVQVPLRGLMLRLRLIDGTPSMKDLGIGSRLRVQAPHGEREVRVTGYSVTGGRPTQQRLERARELDVLVDASEPIEIGWVASGPVR